MMLLLTKMDGVNDDDHDNIGEVINLERNKRHLNNNDIK